MTLTTHALMGAAVASFTPQNPALGFCAGFASHYLLDIIPHYDYPLYSGIKPQLRRKLHLDGALVHDTVFIAFDIAAGIALSLLFFGPFAGGAVLIWGAVGAMLPDILNGIWGQWRRQPLTALSTFHQYMHAHRRLEKERKLLLGVISQTALAALIVACGLLLHTLG